jgi:hypothetical protein
MNIVQLLGMYRVQYNFRIFWVVLGIVLGMGSHADAGCTSDKQCKGDRICEQGRCVDPHLSGVGGSCSKDKDCPGNLVCDKNKQCRLAGRSDLPSGRTCPGGDEFTPPGCVETDRSAREREAKKLKDEKERDRNRRIALEELKNQCEDEKDAAEQQATQSARQCDDQCGMMQ